MGSSLKKIGLLFFGETGSREERRGWLDKIPELKAIANIATFSVYDKKTADAGPEDWLALAKEISRRYGDFNGFVVVHDLDNLLYTASSVSFLLRGLSKPVVFTGGLTGQTQNFGSKSNLINACQLAGYNLAEVCLLFGNKILRANQAMRNPASPLNLFSAPPAGILGQIDFSIRLFNQAKKPAVKVAPIKLSGGLDGKIAVFDFNPSITLADLKARAAGKSAILIKADVSPISSSAVDFLEQLAKDMPVVIFDQQKINRQAEERAGKLIFVSNLTLETASVKLMWSLKQTSDFKKIKDLMAKDIAGEVII